jgi:DNA-binding MarR family transcriptional regulator
MSALESRTEKTAISEIEEAVVALVRASRLPRLQERLIAEAGTPVERASYVLLREVAERGQVRPTELARVLGVDISTISRQVGQLERQGLVARVAEAGDRRVSSVRLAAAGQDTLDRLRAARHRLFMKILADWSAADCATLAPLLDRLARDMTVEGGRR